MAYLVTNPPQLVSQPIAGRAIWTYTDTDVHTDVDAADYFTNGSALGMKVGDIVIVSKSNATIGSTVHYVSAVTANGAATIAPAILA